MKLNPTIMGQFNLTSLRQAKFTVPFIACLLLSGCASVHQGEGSDPTPGQPVRPDWISEAGITVTDGVTLSMTGCELHYRVYRPTGADPGDLVVVGHGFLRAKERMTGLAHAVAKSGVTTVTLDFCNDRFWNGGHFRNALDLTRVAEALGARRVVYTGFSAGALAALIAARNDTRAIGVVALDLVDAQHLGVRAAASMERPVIGLVGEPSCCNAQNNGLTVYAVSRTSDVKRIVGADHCDFESPTDWLCRLACERGASIKASPRQEILRTTTEAVGSLLPHDQDSPDAGGR